MTRRIIKSKSLSKLLNESIGMVLRIDQLIPYSNHFFEIYDQARLWNLADSISDNGLISPIIVREYGDEIFQILSGHNRVEACKLLGHISIECKVIEVDDVNAAVIVLESNLEQRSFQELKLSNQIKVIAEYYYAIKQQGVRMDLVEELEEYTSGQSGQKLNSRKAVSNKFKISERKMARLVKMNALIDELKLQLDEKKIKFMVAYHLSYLNHETQRLVCKVLEQSQKKLSKVQAEDLKKISKEGSLSDKQIIDLLNDQVPKDSKNREKLVNVINSYFEVSIPNERFEELVKVINAFIDEISR